MRRTRKSFVLPIAVLAGQAAVFSAAAQERKPGPTADEERIARLEALVQQQQGELQKFRQQFAEAGRQNLDAERAELMRRQIREILSEKEFRESLMPSALTAGYDNGFYIRSADDQFLLKFNGLLQFRWTYYDAQRRNHYLAPRLQRDDRTGFDVERVRFWMSGNAWSPDLTYYLQVGGDASGAYDAAIYYAWVNYRRADEFQMKFGIFDLATTRNTMGDDAAQHFIDRPVFDAVYGLGTGLGVRLWGQLFQKRLEYFADIVNSTADGENVALGRTITGDPAELDNNPAFVAKLLWHALGEAVPNDFVGDSDSEFHKSPALDFGLHYAFNDDHGDRATTRLPFPLRRTPGAGGFGLTTINGTQINQFGVDAAFKWQGFSVLGEYAVRLVDPRRAGGAPYTPLYLLTGEESTVAQHGGLLSVGYFLPIPGLEKKLEVVGRVGGISTLAEGHEGVWEYGGGLNYYIKGNNVKLQADVTRVYEVPITSSYSSLANVNDDALIFRIQLQMGF